MGDPLKRLGFRDYKALLLHPFFEGVLREDGTIDEKRLKRRPFRVKVDNDFNGGGVIPKDLVFQFLKNSKEGSDHFNIPDFTHYEVSASGVVVS